ncbi:MAG: CoA ester lyase [Lachnospiraceae bacterium]|jgi:citrate lyase subunit beta/citryl-CoA lyase|nr:CoA ester lyase [Lachnospiraceae bacterium]
MEKNNLRRSLLYIPGSSQKMIAKAKTLSPDGVIFDLEDAVSIAEKDKARENVATAIAGMDSSSTEIIVRINAMDTFWGYQDILAIAKLLPSAIILPKADEKGLITADMVLGAMEREMNVELYTVKLIPLFETTYSITNAYQVLGSTPRISGVQLGAEDLTKEQEIVRTAGGEEILYARQQLAMAARARQLDILDTPFTGIQDLEGLRKDALLAKSIGFTGKTCIHPSHIDIINEVFSPTREEIEQAEKMLAAFEEALKAGKGACMYQNKMVDAPVAERAKHIIDKANRIKRQKGE